MTDFTTFLENNGKYAVYTGGNIHGLYCDLEMIVDPTTLTNLGQKYHIFSPPSSITNDTASLQTVIADLRIRQNSICKFCGSIGKNGDA